jgi:hypothetical protein
MFQERSKLLDACRVARQHRYELTSFGRTS